SPSARLYSAVPRLSQCPSTVTLVVVHLRIQSESFCSAPRPSSVRSELSSAKNTSPSGFSAFSCSSDFWLNRSCSLGEGAAGCAAVGGGVGGAGGAGVAAGGGGGG